MAKSVHDEVEDADIFMRLHRRMANHEECWRRCKSPACRRRQSCVGDASECVRDGKPRTVSTPQELADAMHDLRMQLDKRRAELRAQTEEDERLKVAGAVQTTWPKPPTKKSVANEPSAKSRGAKWRAPHSTADATRR